MWPSAVGAKMRSPKMAMLLMMAVRPPFRAGGSWRTYCHSRSPLAPSMARTVLALSRKMTPSWTRGVISLPPTGRV